MFTLKEGEDDEFHIGTIALLPESRGLGIGTRLIEFAEEQASLQGFCQMFSDGKEREPTCH